MSKSLSHNTFCALNLKYSKLFLPGIAVYVSASDESTRETCNAFTVFSCFPERTSRTSWRSVLSVFSIDRRTSLAVCFCDASHSLSQSFTYSRSACLYVEEVYQVSYSHVCLCPDPFWRIIPKSSYSSWDHVNLSTTVLRLIMYFDKLSFLSPHRFVM